MMIKDGGARRIGFMHREMITTTENGLWLQQSCVKATASRLARKER
ncbi:MAG TPA: hypothetical protein VH985_14685 [Candidatus Binatia bacterium]